MAITRTAASTDPTTDTAEAPPTDRLVLGPGRWISNWQPEHPEFWNGPGRPAARRNLHWSVFCEFLGFAVWQLWSVTVVFLPAAGFDLSTSQQFWLVSLPPLVGAVLRVPYSFTVALFGGRNWTVISALLLLIPTTALALALSTPETPVWVLYVVAALAGFGGGNFASSMANITFFFPAREKGAALGLNAAGGNIGVAVAQFLVPLAVTLLAFGTFSPNLPMAGLIWIPFILLAAWGAHRYMHNLSHARNDLKGSLSTLREPHLWLIAVIYIGTFGSFMGFGSVFPTLISLMFPAFTSLDLWGAAISMAFLGPLVGSLARPLGGRLADRRGGARVTLGCFIAMSAVTAAVVLTLPWQNFWLYLGLFLALFTLTGIANGSSYRMIPLVFRLTVPTGDPVGHERKASAALGLIGAVGGFGGFLIPQVLRASHSANGSFDAAFWVLAALYLGLAVFTYLVYRRPGTALARANV
ncbi:MFS transporter [Citricoccus zhacaiensis]|uniref:MFS transporter n=1 Tax=Citricoccus zhacaiensis TaxID=489142 RepID=A0ABQ2M272_9MICC|nr:MFS transporter [Citricoccus zhacaiensis]GGO45872.1 MFS transporter [Citricoccus zhacaiensis]